MKHKDYYDDQYLVFLKELTKRFTGEFAIRPLLKQYPEEVMDELIRWSEDKNVHIRRLSSEGVRIRLPWSQKLTVAPEKLVQKSVGNNLNDLYREAPEKAEFIIAQWRQTGQSKGQEWIIRRGMRNQNRNGKE